MSAPNNFNLKVNKKSKKLTRSELEQLDKTALIEKILTLEAHNVQLKNILEKKLEAERRAGGHEVANKPSKKANKKFDFSNTPKRHVLLKLLYFGWDYQGFATQEHTIATIESYLFDALTRTCLIESRETSNYNRCGRTDKEVSAFSQVISIDVRSKFPIEEQLTDVALANEIDYCNLLNRVLPKDIQCICWMPLRSREYSARFDCKGRSYRYYFPKGDMNIEAMQEAAKSLEGHRDFRNFCKMDVNNGVTNFIRHLQKADIQRVPSSHEEGKNAGYTMYYLEIQANAFLWHQIRCIMALLILIGEGKEAPEIIQELLDVGKNPCKPQYMPAIGLPLNLYNCVFEDESTEESTVKSTELYTWIYKKESFERLIVDLQSLWAETSIKCTMMRDCLSQLACDFEMQFGAGNLVQAQHSFLLQHATKSNCSYIKLKDRPRCESLENRVDHYKKKQRLISVDDQEAADAKYTRIDEDLSC